MSSSINSSQILFKRACEHIPGGVNSPVRSFSSVGGTPTFIERGSGVYVYDVDGNRYLDFVASWGPLILGHSAPEINQAIVATLERGTSFGAATEAEVDFAELISQIVPSIESLRLVNSGTEATMTAARLARGYTEREYLMKFNGCYHGHADMFLVQAGSGVATCGIAGSAGVPEQVAEQTVSVEFNNLEKVRSTIDRIGPEKFAAIILEPVAGNMGLVLPKEGFLEGLREICDQHGILLIFDEVMCGFRVAFGGVGERFSVNADLTILGKVVGGGLPMAAFGGKREIMNHMAPVGPVYQAGTLSGNPLAVAAGLATLRCLQKENPYSRLENLGIEWASGMMQIGERLGVPIVATSCGSMLGFFFSEQPVHNFSQAKQCDADLFKRFFHGMLAEGVYLAPSPFEAGFLGAAHNSDHIETMLSATEKVLREVA